MAEKKTFKQWCKDHKTGLIIAGTAIAGGLLIYAGIKSDKLLSTTDHDQLDYDPDDNDEDENEYYDIESIDEDIYSDASIDLMNSISDGKDFYKDSRTYEVAKNDSVTVNMMMFRHPTDESADFNSRVNMISEICPDIETDDIIQFLKEEEEVNAELDAEEAEA